MRGPLQNALRMLTRAARSLALRSAGEEGPSTSIVRHVGRRSGRAYETPVIAARHDDSFLIALPYGERTDWLKNVLDKGSATIVTDGHSYRVERPRVIPMAEATTYLLALLEPLAGTTGLRPLPPGRPVPPPQAN